MLAVAQDLVNGIKLVSHPAPRGPEANLPLAAARCGTGGHHSLQTSVPEWEGLHPEHSGRHWGLSFCQGASPSSLLVLVCRGASPPLGSSLAHEAVSQLLQTDLSEFRKLPGQEEEEDDDEEEKAPVTREFSFLSGWDA